MKNARQDGTILMFRILLIFLCAFVSAGLLSCAGISLSDKVKISRPGDRGFIDDDKFWIKESGNPEVGMNDSKAGKNSSRESAVKNARYRAYESFTGSIIESGNGMCSIKCVKKFITEKFSTAIQGGRVIYEKYDSDENCEIIYVIEAPRLKWIVMSCPEECAYPD